MSADTHMSEMLVVATKRAKTPEKWSPTEVLCVNLSDGPSTLAKGYALASDIAEIPVGQKSGSKNWGNWTRVTQRGPGDPWGAVANRNVDLIAIAEELLDGSIFEPASVVSIPMALPMVTLGDLADTGPTHDLIGHPGWWRR